MLYVAPGGRPGNPGTRAEPLGDLSRALERVGPGDTVVLRGGTYRPERTVGASGLSGTATSPVSVEPEPGERPVFDFERADVGGLRFSDCHWLELRGFEVRNAPSRGLFVERSSSDVVVADVTVTGSGGDPDASGTGVFVFESRRVTLRNVAAFDSYDPGSGGNNADGIAVEASPGTVVTSCVAAGNADDGFDLWKTGGVTLRRCRAFDNGWRPNGVTGGDGNGFKLGGGDDSGDNAAQRCIAYRNRTRGFHDNGARRRLRLTNCTAWNNPVNFRLGCHLAVDEPTCPSHRLRNNLSHDGSVQLSPFVDSTANSWDLNVGEPRFTSLDPEDPGFLRLTADSPAVDAGVDVGLSYSGDAPDLGAFEYDPGTRGAETTTTR